VVFTERHFLSHLKLSTGFATASAQSLNTYRNQAITIALNPILQTMSILIYPVCKILQPFINTPICDGVAMTIAMPTRIIKSFVRSETIPVTEAPKTFLITYFLYTLLRRIN
jgi:hypothetical protein